MKKTRKIAGVIIVLLASSLLSGFIGWHLGASTRVRVDTVKVVGLKQTAEMYIEVLEAYFDIDVEEEDLPRVSVNHIEVEVLDLNRFVNWLKVNGHNKCYYEYNTNSDSFTYSEEAFFWVHHSGKDYYFWRVKI